MASKQTPLTSVFCVVGDGPVPLGRVERTKTDFSLKLSKELVFGARKFRGTRIPLAKTKGGKVRKPQKGQTIVDGGNVTVISLPFCREYLELCREFGRKPDLNRVSYKDGGKDYESYYTVIEWQPETVDQHERLVRERTDMVAANIDIAGTIPADLTGNVSGLKGTEFPMYTVTKEPLIQSVKDGILSTGIFTLLSEQKGAGGIEQVWAVDVNKKFMDFFMTKPGQQQSRNGPPNNIFKLRPLPKTKLEPYSFEGEAWVQTAKNIMARASRGVDLDAAGKALAILFGHVGRAEDGSDSVRPVFINKRVPFSTQLPERLHPKFKESRKLANQTRELLSLFTEWDEEKEQWRATDELVKLIKALSSVTPKVTRTKRGKDGKSYKVTESLTWQSALGKLCFFRKQLEAKDAKLPERVSIETNLKNQKRAFKALSTLLGDVLSQSQGVEFIDFGVEDFGAAAEEDNYDELEDEEAEAESETELEDQGAAAAAAAESDESEAEEAEDDGEDTTEDEADEPAPVPATSESVSAATAAAAALLAAAAAPAAVAAQ